MSVQSTSQAQAIADRAAEGQAHAGALAALDAGLARYGPLIAMAAAVAATLGSLYFSEVRHYIPCRLCWFQRIFMYPLAIVLPVGLLRRDPNVRWYVLPLAAVGGAISVYHVLLQKTSWFSESSACLTTVPCSSQYINWLGFVSIPVLALTAFAIVLFSASAQPPRAADGTVDWPQRSVVLATLALLGLLFGALWTLRL